MSREAMSAAVVTSKATDKHGATDHGSNAPQPAALQKVYPMVKGDGEDSYSKNSEFQAFQSRRPLLALTEALQRMTLPSDGETVVIADLGSSSGPNTITDVAHIVDNLRRRLPAGIEFQAYFNDLPSTDFNNLFQLLSNDPRAKKFYAAGLPGSFYDRLLPQSSVHVFYSANSLHWLSKVPDTVVQKGSPAYNSGHIWYQDSRSAVGQAYQQRALLDMKSFYQLRAAELASGGLLLTTMTGRESSKPHGIDEKDLMTNFLSELNEILRGLVADGLMTEQQHDSLNIPMYYRTLDDMRDALASCDSMFEVAMIKMERVEMEEAFKAAGPELPQKLTAAFKAGFNSQLESHLGKDVSDVIWQRYVKLAEKNIFRSEFASILIVGLIRK